MNKNLNKFSKNLTDTLKISQKLHKTSRNALKNFHNDTESPQRELKPQ